MLTSEVLDKAADKIENGGWFRDLPTGERKYFYPPDTRARCFCAYTALTNVTSHVTLICGILAKYIDPKYQQGNAPATVITWNDAQSNKSNVIRKYRAVAKKLREKGE